MASLPRTPEADDAADRADKIALSRLEGHREKRQEKPRPPKQRKPRTQRACNNCRRRKVRCTGELPQCRNCAEQGATCVYSMARRDRFKEAMQKNVELVVLLRDLSLHVDEEGAKMIERHLESLGDQTTSNPPPDTLGKHSRESTPSEGASEALESSDSGPDAVHEDILHDRKSRATGFVGSNSPVQWLRSLKSRMGRAGLGHPSSRSPYSRKQTFQHGTDLRVSNSTFYLDDDELEVDLMVDPYQLPSPDMAEELFGYYIKTIHDSFPIVPEVFAGQFHKWNVSRRQGRHYQIPEEWQAMLNLVMAIGAQYARLTQVDGYGDEREDTLYMTRACRILRLDRIATSLPAPSLTFIQSIGLLSLYYLTIGQVSRAWMVVGISLRFALAAGLHLLNDNPSVMLEKKETLVRTWWSLHSIESLICAIIGRPCIIPNDECTVPLPQVSPRTSQSEGSMHSSGRGDSDTVTGSSFLGARITIALIMQKALARLYSPQLSVDSWDQIQTDITDLLREIDDWAIAARLAGLSPASTFEPAAVERAKLILDFQYQSVRLLICRPCLTRIERRNKAQSDTSAEFCQRTADMCVASAQAIARLLPDATDLRFIYEQSPWWCIVHNIMQALAVFLLKMSLGTGHDFHDGGELANNVKKLIGWLYAMSAGNTVADYACQVAIDIIRASSPRIRIDVSDIVSAKPGKPDRRGSMPVSQSNPPTSSTSGPLGQARQHKMQSFSSPLSAQSYPPPTIPPQNTYPAATLTRSPTAPMTFPQDAFPASAASSIAPHAHLPTPQADQPQSIRRRTLSVPTQQELTHQNVMSHADLAAAWFNSNPKLTVQPGFDTFRFSPDLSLDAGMPMPTISGNPFPADFDQVDAIAGIFGEFSGRETNLSEGMETGAGFGPTAQNGTSGTL